MTQAIMRLWTRRKPSERAFAVIILIATLAVSVDIALIAPLRKARAQAQVEAQAARTVAENLEKQVGEQSREGDAKFQERIEALKARRKHAEQVIRDAQVDLIAPSDMRAQLAAILAQFPKLKVLSVTSAAPAPFGEVIGATGITAGPAVAAGVYQHGLEIVVEGRYFDLIEYLEALENAPRRIYWRELELAVDKHGIPVTRISFFTLSKEAIWIRI